LVQGQSGRSPRAQPDEYKQVDYFRQHVRYVQLEPVWGGQQDTRGRSERLRFAIVRLDHAGPHRSGRPAGRFPKGLCGLPPAQALVNCMPIAAIPLLAPQARLGTRTEVVAECFHLTLQLNPAAAVPFVAGFLDSPDDAICTSAALALGDPAARRVRAPDQIFGTTELQPHAE